MSKGLFSGLNTLRVRLLLNFLMMLAVVVAVTLYTVQSATYKHSTGTLLEHVRTSSSVVEDKLNNQVNRLNGFLTTLSKNFNFIKLVATAADDKESLDVALLNFQNRIDADLAWVQDADGNVVTHTPGIDSGLLPTNTELFNNEQLTWWRVGQQFYLLKTVPMAFTPRSQDIQAWIAMGIRADKLITEELVNLTGMEVSLLHLDKQNTLIGSTHDESTAATLFSQALNTTPGLHSFNGDYSHWIYASSSLGLVGNAQAHLVLGTVEDKAYLSYNSLLLQLVAILAIAAVMALVAAMLLSNGITRPVTKLVNVTRKIREGQYVKDFPTSATREVDSLSTAISSMQEGIIKREKEIQFLAYYDSLTELPNRNQFQKHLSESICAKPEQQFAVLTLDVDRFKEINDTIGHDAGDKLLKEIPNRLKSFAQKDTFIAHTGGDEFAIVSPMMDEQSAGKIAEYYASMFDKPFLIEQLALEVRLSIGVACYPHDAKTALGLMQCADIALYSGKGNHFAYTIYHDELNKHSVQRLSLMSELRGALAEGQLQLFYQPKLAIEEGRITTVECLIRWIHPTHGFIPPDEFIPLAEQTGAIRDVTKWGLRTGMAQQKKWQDAGYNIGIAVNISAVDLIDMQLPAYVAELLTEFDTAPEQLTLEVTESAVMTDPTSALKALNTLQKMGIELSIDDFGTGYSSMAQLKKMPVNELKIDKAFVLELATSEDDQVMVRTLMSLAQNLGLKTVAEGVEDAATLKFLQDVGCTKAQGFHLSRPLPADKFDEWISTYDIAHYTEVEENTN
ncbi:MAG: EAL domain-containing protein [Aestuariibacter sp.]